MTRKKLSLADVGVTPRAEPIPRAWHNHGISSIAIIEEYVDKEGRDNVRINPDGTLWVNQKTHSGLELPLYEDRKKLLEDLDKLAVGPGLADILRRIIGQIARGRGDAI